MDIKIENILIDNNSSSENHNYISNLSQYLNEVKKNIKIGDVIFFRLNIKDIKKVFLGYFYYHGFKIISLKEGENYIEIKLIKYKETENLEDKKYSWFIKLPRTGKNGKRIYVLKLRTMQPYSEYLQDYIIKQNGFNSDGTIKNDFRIIKFGKFARKYWLDELPMLINLLKFDLKFIGVRPLSDTMLNSYPIEHKIYRNSFKPGLIPPYYIDRPKTFDEIIESEKRYLKKYEKHPIKTDIEYFLKFLKVVFLKGVRSS